MNAPLPDSIRKAMEAVTLDDRPRSGWRRSHREPAGCTAARCGFVDKRV